VCADVEKSGSGGQQKDIGSFNEASAQEAEAGGIFVLVAGEGGQPVVAAGGINVQVVDKVHRKLFGRIEMPIIHEKSSSVYLVDKVQTVWEEQKNSLHLTHVPKFNIVRAHLPKDATTTYYIVDDGDIIADIGSHRLSIRDVSYNDRKKLLQQIRNMGWLAQGTDASRHGAGIDPTSVRLCRAEFIVDPTEFFKDNGERWKEYVDLWCTENLRKSVELVDSFKATQIPFIKGVPSDWQPFNSHAVWLTNTGVGKSVFNEIAGNVASVDLSVSGLFGANTNDYKSQQTGALSGHGMLLIDEVEQLKKFEWSNTVLLSLLSYMEQGRVERRLRIPIRCEGTKAIVFASNPVSDDSLDSVLQFLSVLQGDADSARMGRRLSLYLHSTKYETVRIAKPITSLRAIMPKIIHFTLLRNWDKKIVKVLKTNMPWVNDVKNRYVDIRQTFDAKSQLCPSLTLKRFIHGLGLGLHRTRMSAIRIIMLENLNLIGTGSGFKGLQKVIEEQREERFLRLAGYSLKSVDNLLVDAERIQPTKECALSIRTKFPNMSLRDIGSFINVSHETVRRWLNE